MRAVIGLNRRGARGGPCRQKTGAAPRSRRRARKPILPSSALVALRLAGARARAAIPAITGSRWCCSRVRPRLINERFRSCSISRCCAPAGSPPHHRGSARGGATHDDARVGRRRRARPLPARACLLPSRDRRASITAATRHHHRRHRRPREDAACAPTCRTSAPRRCSRARAKFLFVGGLQRSGTSTLASLLGEVPGVSGLRFDALDPRHMETAPWKRQVDVHTGTWMKYAYFKEVVATGGAEGKLLQAVYPYRYAVFDAKHAPLRALLAHLDGAVAAAHRARARRAVGRLAAVLAAGPRDARQEPRERADGALPAGALRRAARRLRLRAAPPAVLGARRRQVRLRVAPDSRRRAPPAAPTPSRQRRRASSASSTCSTCGSPSTSSCSARCRRCAPPSSSAPRPTSGSRRRRRGCAPSAPPTRAPPDAAARWAATHASFRRASRRYVHCFLSGWARARGRKAAPAEAARAAAAEADDPCADGVREVDGGERLRWLATVGARYEARAAAFGYTFRLGGVAASCCDGGADDAGERERRRRARAAAAATAHGGGDGDGGGGAAVVPRARRRRRGRRAPRGARRARRQRQLPLGVQRDAAARRPAGGGARQARLRPPLRLARPARRRRRLRRLRGRRRLPRRRQPHRPVRGPPAVVARAARVAVGRAPRLHVAHARGVARAPPPAGVGVRQVARRQGAGLRPRPRAEGAPRAHAPRPRGGGVAAGARRRLHRRRPLRAHAPHPRAGRRAPRRPRARPRRRTPTSGSARTRARARPRHPPADRAAILGAPRTPRDARAAGGGGAAVRRRAIRVARRRAARAAASAASCVRR